MLMGYAVAVNLRAHFNNLPTWLTQLVGREREIQAACALLERPEVRLLTMTGVGGIGKTKLATHVGEDLLEKFIHGVCWVSLSGINDPQFVLPAIAQALGLNGREHRPLIERLHAFLHDKHLLLLLDNFEQVAEAASLLPTLLSSCSQLKILVTSRAMLHLQGEYEFPVAPLALPDLKGFPPDESLLHYSAVALFVQRVQAVKQDFQLTKENARSIAEICVRLDGLPLAIELAASRMKIFNLGSLYSRLEQQLDVLTDGRKDAPQRHQTLRNMIQWSYDLLTNEEQCLFRRCCVFDRGFTFAAVEAIGNGAGDLKTPVFELIRSLIDKSLILRVEQDDDDTRMYLLHVIREYGMELLISSGDLDQTRNALAVYYLRLAEEAEPALKGPMQALELHRLEPELENFRAALNILLEHNETEAALRLAIALQQVWMLGGYMNEGLYFLEQGIRATREGKSLVAGNVVAKALGNAGRLAFWQNDPERATALLNESESLNRTLKENQQSLAATLHYQSNIAYNRGEIQRAAAMQVESLQLYQEIGDQKGIAELMLVTGAHALYKGDYDQARELCEEGLALVRNAGNTWIVAALLHYLGWIMFMQGNNESARKFSEESVSIFKMLGKSVFAVESRIVLAYIVDALGEQETAYVLHQESLAMGREMGSQDDIGRALCGVGHLTLRTGDLAQAREIYAESIAFLKGRWLIPRNKWALASSLEGMGEIAFIQEHHERAVQLYAVADAVRSAHGYYSSIGIERSFYDRTLTQTRRYLGRETFASFWEQGHSMTPEQVLRLGSKQETGLSKKEKISSVRVPVVAPPCTNLTRREYQVLCLVAQGMTNSQIAEQLFVSMSTVDTHVRSIYGKLGVTSRVRATRYAVEHDLVSEK